MPKTNYSREKISAKLNQSLTDSRGFILLQKIHKAFKSEPTFMPTQSTKDIFDSIFGTTTRVSTITTETPLKVGISKDLAVSSESTIATTAFESTLLEKNEVANRNPNLFSKGTLVRARSWEKIQQAKDGTTRYSNNTAEPVKSSTVASGIESSSEVKQLETTTDQTSTLDVMSSATSIISFTQLICLLSYSFFITGFLYVSYGVRGIES